MTVYKSDFYVIHHRKHKCIITICFFSLKKKDTIVCPPSLPTLGFQGLGFPGAGKGGEE